MVSTSKEAFERLLLEYSKYFSYTCREGYELSFLNFKILQSKYHKYKSVTSYPTTIDNCILQIKLNINIPINCVSSRFNI